MSATVQAGAQIPEEETDTTSPAHREQKTAMKVNLVCLDKMNINRSVASYSPNG